MNILATNFRALSHCSIILSDLIKKPREYQNFLKSYKDTVVALIEDGYSEEFQDGECEAEMRHLWAQIKQGCVDIMVRSINLIYSSPKDILENLLS